MCNWWFLVKFKEKNDFFGLFQYFDFLRIFPIFFDLPLKKNVPNLGNTKNVNDKHVHLCISQVWSQKTSTYLRIVLIWHPYLKPDIQPNTINLAKIFLSYFDLPPKCILSTLGNTDYLKDIHDNL